MKTIKLAKRNREKLKIFHFNEETHTIKHPNYKMQKNIYIYIYIYIYTFHTQITVLNNF